MITILEGLGGNMYRSKNQVSESRGSKSLPKIQTMETDYLGGNMDCFYGKLTDGRYYYTATDDYTWFLDADPTGKWNDTANEFSDWLDEHETGEQLSEEQENQFMAEVYKFAKKKKLFSDEFDFDGAVDYWSNL